MTMLVVGLVAFLGIHLVPALPALRKSLVDGMGEGRYKGVFAAASLAGLVLIVVGYGMAPASERVFAPLPIARTLAPYAVGVAFVLFAAANMRGHLRHSLQHPMLIGLLMFSAVHLLATGSLRGTVLFGALLAYAVVDLVSAVNRHAVKAFVPEARFDVMAVGGGAAVALGVMAVHRLLFGVTAVSWSL
ncbi:MAG TPA: NnrU family protein [Casimicrobiaceae bacterium]|nr:NnrU family protein [Casimicrobiaceae bacterium]